MSNFLQYKDGLLDGYDTTNMIHVFNKNESALKGSKEFDLIHDRTNIIVMGDSLGDAGMGDGCVSGVDAHILKIGFLNEHVSICDLASILLNRCPVSILSADDRMIIQKRLSCQNSSDLSE